ncbi:hypothetical protein VDGD_02733 [Verticillium dahliae]|nr:hypothetical protein VdG1_04225 [Verticillium dahliae VDG1]RBQ92679.1 hypothetical protein VDGD_02733 [Verticillium dahliae]
MKSSVVLAVASAAMALGVAIDKRAMETVWDIDYVTVTVTAGAPEVPAPTPGNFFPEKLKKPEQAPAPVFSTIKAEPQPEPETEKPKETPKTTAPAPISDDMQTAALEAHNIHRRNNSAPALAWGSNYAAYALQTAQTCVFEHDLTPGGGGYGQNLAMWGATDGDSLGAAKAVSQATTNMWYNGEVNLYSPNFYGGEPDMTNFMEWGHYSQLVWVDTTTLGCAVHFCEKGTMDPNMGVWYTVCNYFPAGNMQGSFAKNVLPPGNAPTVTA